jgi:RimJ/RimL family protein N-acetyltransferase
MTYPLLTARLSIEPLSLRDLEAFVEYRRDPVIARYQSWDTSYSASQGAELIASQEGILLAAKDDWLQLAIHDRLNGVLVGDLAIHLLDEEDCSFELGFTIAIAFQGNGYAFEACSALMNYLFLEVGAKRLTASTDRRNLRSIKLLDALGFQLEPSRTFTEEFEGEIVTVDEFEISKSYFQSRKLKESNNL